MPKMQFVVSPASILEGKTTQFRWAVQEADSIKIESSLVTDTIKPNGTATVTLSRPGAQTYKLTATNELGTTIVPVTVNVMPALVKTEPTTHTQTTPSNNRSRNNDFDNASFWALVNSMTNVFGQGLAPLLLGSSEQSIRDITEPTVVPILVTDNMEQSSGVSSQSYLRWFALALSMLEGGFAAGGQFGKQRPALQTAVGAGNAIVRIQFNRSKDNSSERMLFAISGADMVDATSIPKKAVSFGPDGWGVAGDARIAVAIANAADDSDIEVVASNSKQAGDPIRLHIVRSVIKPVTK